MDCPDFSDSKALQTRQSKIVLLTFQRHSAIQYFTFIVTGNLCVAMTKRYLELKTISTQFSDVQITSVASFRTSCPPRGSMKG